MASAAEVIEERWWVMVERVRDVGRKGMTV